MSRLEELRRKYGEKPSDVEEEGEKSGTPRLDALRDKYRKDTELVDFEENPDTELVAFAEDQNKPFSMVGTGSGAKGYSPSVSPDLIKGWVGGDVNLTFVDAKRDYDQNTAAVEAAKEAAGDPSDDYLRAQAALDAVKAMKAQGQTEENIQKTVSSAGFSTVDELENYVNTAPGGWGAVHAATAGQAAAYSDYQKFLNMDTVRKFQEDADAWDLLKQAANYAFEESRTDKANYSGPIGEYDTSGYMWASSREYDLANETEAMFYFTDKLINTEKELAKRGYSAEDIDAAVGFLSRQMEEVTNAREGAQMAENILGIDNGVGRVFATGLYGVQAGLDQFGSGVEQFFTKEELPTSAIQYGSQYIQEDLADTKAAKHLYNATTTIGNMAPSILVSAVLGPAGLGASAAVAGGIGSATMGVSAAGNAYKQKLAEGYSPGQARTYSTLVGVAEGALQYALGGIGKLGGVADDALIAKIKAVENGIARAVLTGTVRIGSEITEEELQNFIEPLIASVVFNEKYDAPTIEELVETAIVTTLSTGVLSGGEIVSAGTDNNTQSEGAQLLQNALGIKENGFPVHPTEDSTTQEEAMQREESPAQTTTLTNSQAEKIMTDPEQMAALGIDIAGKTKSQVRNEVKAAVMGKNAAQTETEHRYVSPADNIDQTNVPNNIAPAERAVYNENTQAEVIDNEKEVYLRNGSQRPGSAYPGGEVSAVEESAGRNPSGQAARKAADRGAASLTYGERVSTSSLGIGGGSIKNNIRLLKNGDTQHTAEAKRIAKERGLRVYFFADDNLNIRQSDGKFASARGYISGDRVFIRVDHPLYTADQIMRHEAGHDMIAKGEVDLAEVRRRIKKAAGGRQVRKIAKMYADAYAGAGMTADEIWAEVVCDSLGDMNIFASRENAAEAGEFFNETKQVVQTQTGKASAERGPPVGKMSKEPKWRTDLNKQEYARLESFIKYDIQTSDNAITETANWMYKEFSGLPVFAIYSTQNESDPTVLYEVKGEQAVFEKRIITEWLGGNDSGTNGTAADFAARVKDYGRKQGGKLVHRSDTVQTGDAVGNGAVDGRTPGREPSRALRSCLENLLSGRGSDGLVGKASRDLDVEYMSAVENGDMETAQRMVDEAAKAAGYTVKAYHGTDSDSFNVFDRGKIGTASGLSILGDGFYFAEKQKTAEQYGKNVYAVYLKQNSPYHATADDAYRLNAAKLETDGYDGVALPAGKGTIYMVLDSEQIKSAEPVTYDNAGNVIPLSERFNPEKVDIRFSMEPTSEFNGGGDGASSSISDEIREEIRIQLARMGKEYGFIPAGESPYRETQIPRRTERGNKVSQTVRTILEARATPEEMVPNIEKLVADGKLSYNPISDESAINDATAYIERVSWDAAQRNWFTDMENGVVSKSNTTIGWLLYNNAANKGDTKLALDILNEMVKSQRSAAQALQATRILKTLSPETQLYGVQKSIDGLTEDLKERYGDKIPDLKINPAMAEKFLNAETDKGRAEAMQEIYRDIGRQMPSRFIDKFNAWRYLAMLGNPRTHVRNIVGNAGFAPVVAVKNLTAAGIERVVLRNTENRTKAVALATKEGRHLMKAAWADYANVIESMPDGKYSDFKNANKYIEEGRVIFGRGEGKTAVGRTLSKTLGKATEKVRRFNSGALAHEDMWFSRPYYASALAQYCKAQNISVEELQKGTSKRVGMARNYAMREAQKATYQDTNAFSDWFSNIGRKRTSNAVGKVANKLVEGVVPFRRTPANILARGVEYSPVGLLKSLLVDSFALNKGNITAAEYIDRISAGLTGTALLGFGILLAKLGLVRGHGDDEKEKEEKFSDLQGIQKYALELPNGKSITLDWLAPEALPFFMGVNLWEMAANSKDGVKMGDVLNSIANVTEPMLEMSCLSGLNELIESASSISASDGLSAIPKLAVSATTSLLTQVIPTFLGQIERTFEPVRMTTYTDKNKWFTPDAQYFLGKVSAKIPGIDYGQIPYIDAWGRTESNGGPFERPFNNFINPAYMSEINVSSVESELERLYEATGETDVLPSRASKYFTVDGVKKDLTAEEFVEYATFRGHRSFELLDELVHNKRYAAMTDAEKRKVVTKIYEVANEEAKALISEFELDKFHKDMAKADSAGISNVDYIIFYRISNDFSNITDSKGNVKKSVSEQVRDWLKKSGMTRKQQETLWNTKYSSAY